MKYFIILLMVLSLHGNTLKTDLITLDNLSTKQTRILRITLNTAPNDIKYTLTAIAWLESSFGKHKVGRTTPDYGLFQINLKTYKRRYAKQIKMYKLSDERIKKLLIHYNGLNMRCAIAEIRFWQKKHGKDFFKVWGSYNAGYKGVRNKHGLAYAKNINRKIKAIKAYEKKYLV